MKKFLNWKFLVFALVPCGVLFYIWSQFSAEQGRYDGINGAGSWAALPLSQKFSLAFSA